MSVVLASALTLASAAMAADCPDIPVGADDRRSHAREFFSRAEAAERAGDDLEAVGAYVCSMKMVPHPFTAYNLARVAEKVGDLDLAVSSFRHYLTLKGDATDAAEVEERIRNLETRLAQIRKKMPVEPPAPPPESRPLGVAPPPPPPAPTEPPAGPRLVDEPAPPTEDERSPGLRAEHWMLAGVSLAALGGGVALNLGARSKMDKCHALTDLGRFSEAQDACDAAKPRAYASYGLLAVGAAVAALDAFLIWRHTRGDETATLSVRDGGLVVSLNGRF